MIVGKREKQKHEFSASQKKIVTLYSITWSLVLHMCNPRLSQGPTENHTSLIPFSEGAYFFLIPFHVNSRWFHRHGLWSLPSLFKDNMVLYSGSTFLFAFWPLPQGSKPRKIWSYLLDLPSSQRSWASVVCCPLARSNGPMYSVQLYCCLGWETISNASYSFKAMCGSSSDSS